MHTIEFKQVLPLSIEEAWAFFSSPKNLELITPRSLGFEIKSEVPNEMFTGLFIHYRVRPILGIPTTWVTEITHLRKPFYFVDEQRQGPYKIWHHEHYFREIPEGIEMIDRVNYQLPFGLLGSLIHPFIIKPKLTEIFAYRKSKLQELFPL